MGSRSNGCDKRLKSGSLRTKNDRNRKVVDVWGLRAETGNFYVLIPSDY
jgi:hypothetical protein